jgi:hypothetical protein
MAGTFMGRPISYHLVQSRCKPVIALISARVSHVSRVGYIIDSYESIWDTIDIFSAASFCGRYGFENSKNS